MSDLVVGVDLGGTQLRAALVDRDGTVRRRDAVRTDATGGPNAVIAQMGALIEQVAGDDWSACRAVGLSSPGPLDSDAGVTSELPNLVGWDGFPLRAALAERLGRPVVLENDGIAAAFGEWKFGAGRGLTSFVYITVSTGIGGGIVTDGHLLRGRRGMGGHIGHLTLFPHGELCNCGNPGCLEAYASGPSMVKRAKRAYGELACLPSGVTTLDGIDGRVLVDAARAGDAVALRIMAEEAEFLGIGFVTVLHLYSPEAIVVGGGVSHGLDLLRPGIDYQIRTRAMPAFKQVPVVAAGLGDNSGLLGAAGLALHMG